MCHGDERGKGRQFGAPPHNSEGHTWHHPDRLLFEWVMEGLPLRRAMPAFRGQLTEQQVIAVLAYIKTMWPNEIRQWQLEGSRRYEEQVKKFPPPTLPR
jgi:mono/diheme cytochrome c family protein